MEKLPVPLPVKDDFWQALDSNDLAAAAELIKEAMFDGDYCDSGVMEYRSLLHQHIWKYVTGFRTTHVSDSVEIDLVEIKDNKAGGNIEISFHVSAYLGCKDMDIEEDLDDSIDFTINSEKNLVIVHFLADSQRSEIDSEWAE